jgi:hypothetical protein
MSYKRMWCMLLSLLILSAILSPAEGGDLSPLVPVHPAVVTSSDPQGSRLSVNKQAVVVKTAGWTTLQGTLQCYDRSSPQEIWQPVGEAIPVVVGRNGLGWGMGLYGATNSQATRDGGPEKKEGDGRAPAGIFTLSSAFGYAPVDQVRWSKLPYIEAAPSLRCIDDCRVPSLQPACRCQPD